MKNNTYAHYSKKSNDAKNKPSFSVVESYKITRLRLVSILAGIEGKVVAISSSNASEGKSTTSANIAISLSQLNKKVLLIDADARRSTIYQKLKLEDGLGCMDVISGAAVLDDVIRNYNPYLDVITAGSAMNNPSELFSLPAFEKLLLDARERYDYVIIDTPPINLVSDALIISQKCDGLLLVVRAGVTTYEAIKHTVSSTEGLDINILGVIMNGIDDSVERYYKYNRYNKYGKYGRYGYGYGRYSYQGRRGGYDNRGNY